MTGRYRRAIMIRAEAGRATAEIEDDFHHFAVTVLHDGRAVTGVQGQAVRYPWSSCPLAVGALEALRGLPLAAHPTAIYRYADPLGQCTHMFEMAGLAAAQAARATGSRRYDVAVSDQVDGRSEAELRRDGEPVLRWVLQDRVLVEPQEHRGARPEAFSSKALAALPHEEAEALLILRRAAALAMARGRDLDSFPTAASMGRARACFVFSPGEGDRALRRRGSVRDFSTGPGPLARRA
jgi:hypothetical protein